MCKLGARTFRCFLFRFRLCPAQRAGVLNPLTRKIVFVRPASVRASVCTPFPYCDFAAFHFLFGNQRNRRFSNKKYVASLRPTSYLKSDDFGRKYAILRLTSSSKSNDFGRKHAMLDENTRFCGSLLIRKATILDENT